MQSLMYFPSIIRQKTIIIFSSKRVKVFEVVLPLSLVQGTRYFGIRRFVGSPAMMKLIYGFPETAMCLLVYYQ